MNNSQKFAKKLLKNGGRGKLILLAIIGLVLVSLFTAASPKDSQPEKPEDAIGFYIKNGQTIWIVPGVDIDVTTGADLTPAKLEAMYPMSPEDEAKIIHEVPPCSVIIDGIKYKPEDISQFNGKRLHFISGKDGNLYAFTTREGLERFEIQNRSLSILSDGLSYFYMDVWYTGSSFGILPGNGYDVLAQMGFDNAISSAKASPSTPRTVIYDLQYYQGDSYDLQGGHGYSMLYFQGWNDRASSVFVSYD